jgi:uncharacterized RmlC-like cupin family protein
MEGLYGTARYESCLDTGHLRLLGNELFHLVADVDRLIAGSPPETHGERIGGIDAVKHMLSSHFRFVSHRISQADKTVHRRGEPVVLDPSTLPAILSTQGQLLSPVVSRPAVETRGISSAELWMPPGHAAHPHVHHETDIIVLVRTGEALTLWWDDHGIHELTQRTGQHMHMPRGIPHAALNLSARPVIATEFRSSSVFDDDNHRLPDLEPAVSTRQRAVRSAA